MSPAVIGILCGVVLAAVLIAFIESLRAKLDIERLERRARDLEQRVMDLELQEIRR